VALVKTEVLEECIPPIIWVERISELLVTVNVVPSSLIPSTCLWSQYVHPKHRFLQESHGITYQKRASFIVIAMTTPNLTRFGVVTAYTDFKEGKHT
jgi:hypothetical protein